MIKAIIVDDEKLACESLSQMLGIYYPTINVVATATGINNGYEAITHLKPELVFLDMQLSDGLGFDLLQRFEKIDFKVIIVSAYQEYAVKAFRFSAVDYLLKPVDPDDLVKAVDSALTLAINDSQQERLNALIENTKQEGTKERLLALRNTEGTFIVKTSEIVRGESKNNVTHFILSDGTQIRVTKTLKEFEDLLRDCGFIRCHQSHLINQSKIEKISRFPSPSITLCNGDIVPVSFRKKRGVP